MKLATKIKALRTCEYRAGGLRQLYNFLDSRDLMEGKPLEIRDTWLLDRYSRLADKLEKSILYHFERRNESYYALGQRDILQFLRDKK